MEGYIISKLNWNDVIELLKQIFSLSDVVFVLLFFLLSFVGSGVSRLVDGSSDPQASAVTRQVPRRGQVERSDKQTFIWQQQQLYESHIKNEIVRSVKIVTAAGRL